MRQIDNHQKRLRATSLLLFLVLLLAACGTSSTTPTPVPPTATPLPSSPTPFPTAPTPQPPTPTSTIPTPTKTPTPQPPTPISTIPTPTTVPPPASAQLAQSAFWRMLHFIPDTADYRQWVTFGDAIAWYESWGYAPLRSWNQVVSLDREALLQWGNLLQQTTPAHVLGIDYSAYEEQRAFYGFDLFNVDRWIEAGNPPTETNAFEFSFDGVTIDAALRNSGYAIEELDGGGTLYSIGEDYKINLNFPMAIGKLAETNRIVLLEGQMIITRATQDAHNALLAYDGRLPSLAQNAAFVTAGNALHVSDLAEMGELVGVLIQDGTWLADPEFYLERRETIEIESRLEAYAQGQQLPDWDLVALATRHSRGTTYLILALVLPEGADADAAAQLLADRMRNYVSIASGEPLGITWPLELVTGLEHVGQPTALVVIRVDHPSPLPADADSADAMVLGWYRLFVHRDTLFLLPERGDN